MARKSTYGQCKFTVDKYRKHCKFFFSIFSGVDMFAMLTGGLPFTVEPFSIKHLYAKMVARDMNPLPSDTSAEAIDLLNKLLEPDPKVRITLQGALSHAWLRSNRRNTPVENQSKITQGNSISMFHFRL